jgi:ankyrin repeat protein
MTLLEAVQSGDAAQLKAALKTAIDVNESGEGGRTPLIAAALMGRADLCQVLLDGGADPSLKDDEHETALMKAAANAHVDVCDVLFPLAGEDERDMARAFLKAHNKAQSPDYQAPEFGAFKKAAANASARVSKFVGHDNPADRLDRVNRAEQNAKKKR